jgi:hypothetical protein
LIPSNPFRRRVAAALACAAMAMAMTVNGCSTAPEVVILDVTVVTWPSDGGATAGQVIVEVRNDADRPIDPDVLGRGSVTLAQLLDPDGEDLPGGDARVQLHAVPHVLDSGEAGYLIGEFELPGAGEGVDDARIELNTGAADARAPVAVEGFELVDGTDGVGAEGQLEWDGAGTAVARAIALDAEGRPLGYLATSEVLYDAGDFTMCCFPPTVERGDIDEVVVFGDQAREE